jgi:hypothetical protein
MFGLTEKDADNIGTGLEQINKIKLISIKNSKVRILKFFKGSVRGEKSKGV